LLQWVVVLLNCLLIIFPFILDLLDLGITGTLSSPASVRAGRNLERLSTPKFLWLFLDITCVLKCIRIKVIAMQGASRPGD